MSSKRARAARGRAAAAAKKARAEEAPGELVPPAPAPWVPPPPPRDLINALPLDLLALVFAFAPFRARLRAVGLVCRRWRTAALRSVDTLVWRRRGDLATPLLPAALALFPALTELSVTGACHLPPLPATLCRLSLGACLDTLVAAEAAGVRTLLSAALPSLTGLALGAHFDHDRALARTASQPLATFVARHASQLAALAVHSSVRAVSRAVAALAFPRLEELEFVPEPAHVPDLGPLLRAAPRLRTLALRAGEELLALPPALLSSLTLLEPHLALTPDAVAFLRALPALRHVVCDASDPELAALRPLAFTCSLVREPWRTLEQYPNVAELNAAALCRGAFAPLPLPHLQRVTLGHAWLYATHWEPARAFRTLSAILRTCRSVRRVALYLAGALTPKQEARLAELAREALAAGVRTLEVGTVPHARLLRLVPMADAGWLDVRGRPTGAFADESSSASASHSHSDSDSDSDSSSSF